MFKTALVVFALAVSLQAQNLSDERIVNLAKGGLTEDELVHRALSAPAIQFDLSPAWTDYMLKSGVSENVIKAMAARESRAPTAPEPVPPQNLQPEHVAPFVPSVAASPVLPVTPAAVAPFPAPTPGGRPRIFVGETSEWQASSFNIANSVASYSGLAGSAAAGAFGMSHAGLMKLTISVMNQMNQHCQGVLIVNRPEIADLFVRLDQSTSMWARHDDMAVFNRAGEMIFVTSTHSISRDAKRFCQNLVLR